MPRRSHPGDPEELKKELIETLSVFDRGLDAAELRDKVIRLIPAFHLLRDLGSSLVPGQGGDAARDRILHYLRKYPFTIIAGDELMVVAGIQDWPRRVRELRVQMGWFIVSGYTASEMALEEDADSDRIDLSRMGPDDYALLAEEPDQEAALRWVTANSVRRQPLAVKERILKYLLQNVDRPVTGEELRYVADGATEWARRVRELRTEEGWPIVTQTSGRPDLPVGTYLLESSRQSPEHDRRIPDPVRREVLRRDGYRCSHCGWTHDEWNRTDPRHLELHHRVPHAELGKNDAPNLVTLCTVCHDQVHRESGSIR